MKIYLAGPMTGFEYFNFPAFDHHCKLLTALGHYVFSPADNDRRLLDRSPVWVPAVTDSAGPWLRWAIPGAPSLRVMLGQDLQWIALNADAIVLLPGWQNSKGAMAERALGIALGLEIIEL